MSGAQPAADVELRTGQEQADTPGGPRRRAHQLPSGRHGLQPTFVAANQRERIMAAVAPAAAEFGYTEMSVEVIVARAGVSRRTFYEHFKNKEDAFLAAYDAVVRLQARQIRRAYFEETTVRNRLRAGLRAYLEFTANDPDVARMCIVEVLAAGPRAMARRNEAMRMFAAIIEENIHELIPGCKRAALTAEMIVGGIGEVVMNRILADRIEELPGMADDLLTTILMLDAGPAKLGA
jgi:AcrR family transcriptional regulator